MKSQGLLRFVASFAVAVLLNGAVFAADRQYTTSSGNWATDANWTGGSRPLTGDRAFIGGLYPSGGANTTDVTLDTDESAQTLSEIWVGGYTGTAGGGGTLNVNSGADLVTAARMRVGGGVTGIVNQTAGRIFWSAGDIVVGDNSGGALPGFYAISGGVMSNMATLYLGNGVPGTFTVNGGHTYVSGNLHAGYVHQGTLIQNGGTVTVGAGLRMGEASNEAATYNLSGGHLVVNGANSYVGIAGAGTFTFNQSGGVARFQTLDLGYIANGAYNLSDGELNVNTFNKTAGSALNFTGGTLSANTINFSLLNNGGSLAPGLNHTIGATTISGANNYTQGPTAKLSLQIGGTTQGTTYDWLHVGGTATLDGLLELELVSFTPGPSDTFTVLTAGSVAGTFDNAAVSGGQYTFGDGHQFVVTYNAGSVVLSNYSFIPEPGVAALLALGGLLLARRKAGCRSRR